MVVHTRFFLLVLTALLLLDAPAWAAYPFGYDQRYIDGNLETAGDPLADYRVSTRLTTIDTSSTATDHIRSIQIDRHGVAQNTVLMSCFTDYAAYSREYNGVSDLANPYRPRIWSAVAPEMQQFLLNNNTAPQDMSLRSKQLLGLPADHPAYFVMEFYTNPATTLFRPAMNDDITNPVTSQEFVGEMADPTNPRRLFFNDRLLKSYDPIYGTPYPWTRAGYTYDWASADTVQHFGLTEIMTDYQDLAASTPVENPIWVRSVISIMSYKYYVRATDSFDVTDTCDTLWIGSKFLPVTAGGNQVDIHPGVTITGGEGITVSDTADGLQPSSIVINNAGTIQGPATTNHDGTPRFSSLQFTNTGGTLNNSGIITGDIIGVYGSDTSARSITVNNTGTIRGTAYAIRTGGGNDQINTSGLVDGNIFTGLGNDAINVTGGAITGWIDGGTGTNSLNFLLPAGTAFTFTNNILHMNTVAVQGGRVDLFGQVSGSSNVAVTVSNGGILAGSCTINGSLNNQYAVCPIGSYAPIRLTGGAANYQQASGALLYTALSDPTSTYAYSSNLSAQGTATLANGSGIVAYPAPSTTRAFRNGDMFYVIATAGGVTDNGAVVYSYSPFADITGGVVAAKYYALTLHRTATFASATVPGSNNWSMANALDGDVVVATGAYGNLINQLMFTNTSAFNDTLHQLSPAAYLTVNAATDRTTQYMAEGLSGYLRNRRSGQTNMAYSQASSYQGSNAFALAVGSPTELAGVVKYCADERTMIRELQDTDRDRSVWVNPFGLFYGERSGGDHLGFQSNVAGVQLGIDKQMDENCVVGVGAGYNQTHIATTDLFSSGEIETFRLGPYATWYNDAWYFDSSLTGGFHGNNVGRLVSQNGVDSIAQGDYRAYDVSVYVGGGRDYHSGPYTFSPLVSMQYIFYDQNAFAESGADSANMAIDRRDANSMRTRVGSQLSQVHQWGCTKIVPELFGGWAHEFLANDPLEARFLGGVTPFSVDRGGIFRDSGYYGVSLTALPNDHASVFTRYNGEYSTGGHFTAVDLGVVFAF